MTRATLIVDFDGTACVGDEPALDYALTLDALVPGLHGRVLDWLADPHGATASDAVFHAADDIYQAAWALAEHAQLAPADIHASYRASRARLTSGAIQAAAAPGIEELSELVRGTGGRIVLVTNAPREGLDPILDRLGLAPLFDEVIGDAGKPTGLVDIAEAYLREDGGRIASIGDIWRNDLEPVRALGGRTGLIDRFGFGRGPADWVAPTLDGLIPGVTAWLRER